MSSGNRYYKTYGQLADPNKEQAKSEVVSARVTAAKNPDMMQQILARHAFVVVDIFGSWCGPCMKFKPVFEEMAKSSEFPHIEFVSIDIDNTSFHGSPYTKDVTGVPTLRIYKRGDLHRELRGGNRDELARELKLLA